jgi:hypothetical protein
VVSGADDDAVVSFSILDKGRFPGELRRHRSAHYTAGRPAQRSMATGMANKPDLLAFSTKLNTAALTAVDL